MSLSFEQEPVNATSKVPVITNWTPAIGYMLFYDASIAAFFYFKLILEVRLTDATGTLLGKIKQRRNGYSDDVFNNKARAFFDLREIANTQLIDTVIDQNDTGVPFRTIHKVGANTTTKIYSQNGDSSTGKTQIIALYVKGYYEKSDAANASPTEVTGGAINDTLYYLQASLPLMTPRSTVTSPAPGYIQGTDFDVFNGNSATDRFLSDLETSSGDYNITGYINYVQETDYHTVAFLNDNSNFASNISKVSISYYNSAGTLIGGTSYAFINNNAAGGSDPTTETNTDAERLLYFGAGPGNLETQTAFAGAKPSNSAGWAYYVVKGTDAFTLARTANYYFIKQDGSCKGFKVRRLAWRNSVGGYDYFNFKKKSTQTVEVQRNNYSTMLGTFNKSQWRYNNTQRGKTTRQTTAVLKETLNTDWISEQDGNLLEKLLMSTSVYIIENTDTDYTEAVMITDSSHVRKTIANDRMIRYTINIEYANPLNTNS
tara:strand:+ start:89 stop:1549 length:1461 start_codon:yes stop_codon:yes gene_type:complete